MKKLRILPELRHAAFGRESCAKRVGGANRLLSGTFPFRSPYNPRDLSAPSQRSTGIPVFMDDCLRGTQENFRSYKENQPAPYAPRDFPSLAKRSTGILVFMDVPNQELALIEDFR